MNKVLSSIIAVGFAGATFGAFAQPAMNSTETTVERSSVQVPKDGVRVDEKKSTTTSTTRPAANPESKTTTTTTSKRKVDGDDTVVKAKTKTETETKY